MRRRQYKPETGRSIALSVSGTLTDALTRIRDENIMSNAHEYRLKHGQITEVNGHTDEHLDKYPDVKQHPDSNPISVGFIFDDGSELWITDFNGIKSLYTTPATKI